MDISAFHSLERRPSIHFFLILSDFIVFFQNPTRFHTTVFPAVLTSHFSPLIPLMCAILPWNQYAGQFPFPCVFLTCFLLSVFISKVEKQSAGWHPAFLISRILPTRTPRNTTKSKNYEEAQKYFQLIAVFAAK